MKFYLDTSHFERQEDWVNVPHVIRPYFLNSKQIECAELASFRAASLEEADYAILPMNLEYYIATGKREIMESYINAAKSFGKPVVVINDGDKAIKNRLSDVIVLSQNAYQSRRKPKEFSHSYIVDDPLKIYYSVDAISVRAKGEKPVIGFDGLAGQSILKTYYHSLGNLLHNFKSFTNCSPYIPNKIIPGTSIREKALNLLENDRRIVTQFNKRGGFRGGAVSEAEQKLKTQEFYDNMLNSDYVLCVRGGGNFSKRFYETLAMGRIPVFINTDCVLPFDNIIDWKKYCVWVEKKDISRICDIVIDFHNSLDNIQFESLQKGCRKLWEEHLSRIGELKSLESIISAI